MKLTPLIATTINLLTAPAAAQGVPVVAHSTHGPIPQFDAAARVAPSAHRIGASSLT